MKTTVFSAKKIVTMNPQKPEASHVAIREGRILAVGSLEEIATWGDYELDDRFADKVLFPGLVEGHAHTMEGTLWRYVYCGYFDRMDPKGKMWSGNKSIEDVLASLTAAEALLEDPNAPLTGWQLDPIYLDNKPITRAQLDSVSETRPIGVMNASGHILYVNSKALELAGLMKAGVNHPGITLGSDGLPMGELKGPDAMTPVGEHVGLNRSMTDSDERGLRDFARLCVRTGVTTVTDLAARLEPEAVETMLRVTGEPTFPACVVPLRFFLGLPPKELIPEVARLKKLSTDRLSLGRIKVVADGSIQGFSARMRWPGYHNGAPNGLWYISPEQMQEIYELALAEGIQVHTHTNGDQATQLAIEKLELALKKVPSSDHRFVLQHCQLADRAQFKKMAALKMSVNLFANHHFYWGDEHYRLTVGPDRALRMNATRTALECGVPMTIHSDAPVTPLGPLFTAWCAVNRLTASGRTQGEHEKITVDEALWAVTMGAAHTLHMDEQIGSIEVGKRADFAVLESDPREAEPEGRIFAAADA